MSPLNGLESEEFKSATGLDPSTLVKDLKENMGASMVLRTKLHGLRNVGGDQPAALNEIKEVMEANKQDTQLLAIAVGAIWGISTRSDDRKREAADTGCVELVIELLRNESTRDDTVLAKWALGTLASLAQLDDNKSLIAQGGGLETIVDTLQRHGSEPKVFEWACRALDAMLHSTVDDSIRFDQDMASIIDANGIAAISSAMKTHISENVAQWWATNLLLKLLDRDDPSSVNHTALLMIGEDLISTCTRIMNARSVPSNLVSQCTELVILLVTTATTPNAHQQASEGVSVLLRLVSERFGDMDLHAATARFLAIVAHGHSKVKRLIADKNGVRLLVKSMLEAPNNLDLQRAVATLLWILSSDASTFDSSMLEEIVAAVENASRVNPDDVEFNEAICGYTVNATTLAKGQSDFLPVETVIRVYSIATEDLQKLATRALCAIYTAFPDLSDRMDPGILCIRLLEGVCDGNPEDKLPSCMTLVAILTNSKAARNSVFESGGVATVSAALFDCDSEELAQNLLLLLSTLLSGDAKKPIQLPNEIVQGILQTVQAFPGLKNTACPTIRNALLATVSGFKSINCEGLVEMLTGIIDGCGDVELALEACGALWAFCAKQQLTNSGESSQIQNSVLRLCSLHKDDDTYNGTILSEAAGTLAAVMHCIREKPIPLADMDIDLIISILDISIEKDVENVTLMDRFLDIILTLCFLCKEVLIQFGVIVVVIDCMVEHEGNEAIQQKGCAILAILASTENLQVNLSIAETDGIDMIVSALAGFTENLQIQTDACRALSHLSIDHESRMMISAQGGLILLVNAMNKFQESTELLEAACSALLNLSSDAEEQVLASSNVVETVVSMMKREVLSSKFQEKSLGVLQNVSMRSKDSKRAIADVGGLGAVIFAIKEFMGSPSVLERAFTTLWSLAVLEQNQELIASEGGIGFVINGMMANIASEKVQKQACGCLCTLSSNSENKTIIRDLGGVDAIVYAMWAHYKSDALLIEACRALSSLAVNVATNEVMIVSEGEINAIMSAMRRFPHSERLQEHACVVLRNFLLSSDNAAIVRPQATELQQLMNHALTRFPESCADRANQVLASLN